MRSIPRIFYNAILPVLFSSCAIQVAPGGGEPDQQAPQVISSEPENNSTSFTGKEIRIDFDEYIQLKELNTQLVISPPLDQFPEVKIRKKSMIIHFNDSLLDETTYSLNFGNAITDNNEGNVLKNYGFVFSTGKVIDTLTISGKTINARTRKSEKDVKVMLYRDYRDSVPYQKRPLYFSRSDENGDFIIRNISPGDYKLFAIKETNENYLYDSEQESIAFNDSLVPAGNSVSALLLFNERPAFRLTKYYAEEPGKAVLVFTGKADTCDVRLLSDSAMIGLIGRSFSKASDTLTFWYTNLQSDTLQLLSRINGRSDTLTIRLFSKDGRSMAKRKFELNASSVTLNGVVHDLNAPFRIKFNHPIDKWVSDSILILENEVSVSNFSLTFEDNLKQFLVLKGALKQGASYTIKFPAGMFTDIFGLQNDSLRFDFRVREESDYGTLALTINVPKLETGAYLLQLVDDKDEVFKSAVANTDSIINFNFITPQTCRLRIVSDRNENSQWDAGNYLLKLQPESVRYYPDPITVRANWDVEIKWDAAEIFNEK